MLFKRWLLCFRGWKELLRFQKCACRMYLEVRWLNQQVRSYCWTCTNKGPNTTLWGHRSRGSTQAWWENICTYTLMLFTGYNLHLFCHLLLSGRRLCYWQLYKAHSHRWSRHHLLHPAAPEGEGGGNPTRAVSGDRQGDQGLHFSSNTFSAAKAVLRPVNFSMQQKHVGLWLHSGGFTWQVNLLSGQDVQTYSILKCQTIMNCQL